MSASPRRFEALDSLRGIAACLVVAYHAKFLVASHIHDLYFTRNLFLCVDFFFVLSGFVIAASYKRSLLEGRGVAAYVIKRFGRIYPLHLVMLAALLLYRIAGAVGPGGFNPALVFDDGQFSLGRLMKSLVLAHATQPSCQFLPWNEASWSIAAEFHAYLAFAMLWFVLGSARTPGGVRHLILVLIMAVAGVFLWRNSNFWSATCDFGFIRCVYGFTAGVLTYQVFQRWGDGPPALRSLPAATALEVLLVAACIPLLLWSREIHGVAHVAPIVFAPMVLVFARERGLLSRMLLWRPFLLLGALSYSIYLVHPVVLHVQEPLIRLLEDSTGLVLVARGGFPENASMLAGDLVTLVTGLVVLGVSVLTYRFIEQPGIRWSRRLADRVSDETAVPVPPAGGRVAALDTLSSPSRPQTLSSRPETS